MNKPVRGTIADARMLTTQQACEYTGMGRTRCTEWCIKVGAMRRFGNMVRFDKHVIDKALDAMEPALS